MQLGALVPQSSDQPFYVEDIGRAMWDNNFGIQLQCNSITVDTLKPIYMHIWEQVSVPLEKQIPRLTGRSPSAQQLIDWATATQYIWVPLDFYFGYDYGLSLPTVSLWLTDVKIIMKTNTLQSCVFSMGASIHTVNTATEGLITSPVLVMESVYLDDPERDHFVRSGLRYLICQVQEQLNSFAAQSANATINQDLSFNQPVLEYLHVFRQNIYASNTTANQNLATTTSFGGSYYNFDGYETGALLNEAFTLFTLNANQSARWYQIDPLCSRMIFPKNYHTTIPLKRIYCVPFSLYPEDIAHPSGSLNHSRIDKMTEQLTLTAATSAMTQAVYARNSNIAGTCSLSLSFLFLVFVACVVPDRFSFCVHRYQFRCVPLAVQLLKRLMCASGSFILFGFGVRMLQMKISA